MSTSSGFGNGFGTNLGNDGFGSGFSAPAAVLTTAGLVLRYEIGAPASYGGSGPTVTDLAGNSAATLYNGPTYTSGYLTFNGTNQTLITNTSLASKVTTDITSIVMWAYPTDNGVLLSEVGTAALPNAAGWHESQMEMVGGTMKFGMWNGGSISTVVSSVSTPLNAWYHFAMVYDGTKLNAYVNGAAAGTNTFARQNPIEGGADIHYAIAAADGTNMGDGSYAAMRLGQFLVYDRALSADEVAGNFSAGRGTYGV